MTTTQTKSKPRVFVVGGQRERVHPSGSSGIAAVALTSDVLLSKTIRPADHAAERIRKLLQDLSDRNRLEEATAKQNEGLKCERRKRFAAWSASVRKLIQQQEPGEAAEERGRKLLAYSTLLASRRSTGSSGAANPAGEPRSEANKPVGRMPSTQSRPAWSLSAAKAEHREDVEGAQLIEFAQELDYDEYISQLESESRAALDVALAAVESVKDLEAAERISTESSHSSSDTNVAGAVGFSHLRANSSSGSRSDSRRGSCRSEGMSVSSRTSTSSQHRIERPSHGDDDVTAVGKENSSKKLNAERVAAEKELQALLGHVHSRASLASISAQVLNEQLPQGDAGTTGQVVTQAAEFSAVLLPKIVSHAARCGLKDRPLDVTCLPYLRLNPAA